MNYFYDSHGWLTTMDTGRFTDQEPPVETDTEKANWLGNSWVLKIYESPDSYVAPVIPEEWYVYTGPFKDRLGADALAIAASDHAVCRAVIKMLDGRQYVDLKGDKVSTLLDLLIINAQPEANPFFPGSGPMTVLKKQGILDTKPTDAERFRG